MSDDAKLSRRELQVAKHVADGLMDKTIGDILGISPRTVQDYLDKIVEKIGAKDSELPRRRAIAEWYRHAA